jgi:hypothetical protein
VTPRSRINLPASVHQLLLNRAKQEGRPLQELLQYFAIERFLFRLGRSPHADKLLLKGALMLRVWESPLARPTRDVDLLGRIPASEQALARIVKECFAGHVPDDGIRLEPDSVRTETIRPAARYEGIRVRFLLYLGKIRLPMQVDVGFGDTVVPDRRGSSFRLFSTSRRPGCSPIFSGPSRGAGTSLARRWPVR